MKTIRFIAHGKVESAKQRKEGTRMSGATNFDKLCHRIFDAKNGGKDYLERNTHIRCGNCGNPLYSYYCEKRLYLIECPVCGSKALVKAYSVNDAVAKTFVHDTVVRCGDFRFSRGVRPDDGCYPDCIMCENEDMHVTIPAPVYVTDFCSYGERREPNEE